MAYLRSSILGGVDGVVTSFAIVASASFLESAHKAATVVGASSLLADGLSMGISEYLSVRSEQMLKGDASYGLAAMGGLACFLSFVACGLLPLAVFVVGDEALLGASGTAFLVLLLLGCVRAKVTDEFLVWSLVEIGCLGSIATGVAFAVASVAASI